MDNKLQSNYTHLQRSFGSLNSNNSTPFSDCSGDYSPPTFSDSSDECVIDHLVSSLQSLSIDDQKQAAMELRLLAKHNSDNRIRIARAGAIKPLISLILSADSQLQEHGVTAVLNLSLCDENVKLMISSGVVSPLVKALRSGNQTARENAACALLRLSQFEDNRKLIGRSGAIEPLVKLLETGNIRGKKDACTALYSLCSVKDNRIRAVGAGIMKVLVELMADFGSNMVDKCGFVMSLLVVEMEGRVAVVEEGGIPVLVEIIEVGSQRQKEIVVAILLVLCEESLVYRRMVAREGAIPPLIELSQCGTTRARHKAETLIELLRRPKSANTSSTSTSSDGSPGRD
ncbi:U-box domain-containing protein 14-like [Apium graveolens]|uniref:U-box domain-containing protein 14-like n=1 Tax=Apium graveolens TaxID=4045 RepID=UPI003D797F11